MIKHIKISVIIIVMTDIVSKFKSNQNKGIIWALLNDHNVFNGIDNKYVNSIKIYYI